MRIDGLGKQREDSKNLGMKGENMRIVSLCAADSCCPVVKITDDLVEIGEKDNVCVLTKEQWEALKKKILSKQL